MANFNLTSVILGGRITADPEMRQTPSGTSVTTFSVAVNRKSEKDKEEQVADFFNCVAWRATADFICKYFKKGSAICVQGSLQNRNWTDNRGEKHYTVEIVVDKAFFVDSKAQSETTGETAPTPNMEELPDNVDLPF